jgi:hypothetical protein
MANANRNPKEEEEEIPEDVRTAQGLVAAGESFTPGGGLIDNSAALDVTIPDDLSNRMAGSEKALFGEDARVERLTPDMNILVDQTSKVASTGLSQAEQMITGAIPKDVQDSVIRALSETSGQKGIFGQKARGIAARDLGLTSLQVQEQGTKLGKEFSAIVEARREFDLKFNLEKEKLAEAVRAGDLGARELALKKATQLDDQNLQGQKLFLDILNTYHAQAYNYATNENADEGQAQDMASDFAKLIKSIRGQG